MDSKNNLDFQREMTVADMIDFLLTLDGGLPVVTSIFRPREGLIYKHSVKYSQIKVGRDCVYINNYLSR